MKVVIVGGVAGGASAAARLRRLDESAEIVMIERTGYVSYANCGLPYYVGDVITDKRKLTLQTPESFKARFSIDVRVRQEVVSIDREGRHVVVRRLDDGSLYREPYDRLVLSPGARPVVPDIPGVDDARVFTLRTVEDTYAIKDFVDAERASRAVVVGAGFIGLEMAENLRERGMEVAIVQRSSQVMKLIDPDMAAIVHNRLSDAGIDLLLNTHIEGIARVDADAEGPLLVHTAEHDPIPCDMVVLAIGVAPDSSLARDAGLELGLRGSIKVDAHLRTSDPNIYAVGDAIEVHERVTGEASLISLAGPANKQGRLAADNIAGRPRAYGKTLGTSVLKLFELTVASTGITSASARRSGVNFDAVVLTPPNHATYYPGAQSMTLKVLFEKGTGRIIGAQAIGREGVDKRIDVLATAVRAEMTAQDLSELDLAYAPPFSSAKDPVNMAGFMIENILDGLVSQAQWSEALAAAEKVPAAVLLDTRTEGEFARGHVPGAVNVPLDELRDRLDELPRDGMLFAYCQSGLRSYVACRMLAQHGFDCVNIAGGYGFLSHARRDGERVGRSVGPCGLEA